jgi:hypothetical protein
MLQRIPLRAVVLPLAAALAFPLGLTAQARPQQQMQMHQQMMQRMQEQARMMGETMRHMEQVRQRWQAMENHTVQAMEQLRQQGRLQAPDAQLLRRQERLRDMAHAMSGAAGEMNRVMERARDMVDDPDTPWGQDAEQEMNRLREHMENMARQMEDGLQIMERLQLRLGAPGS